MIEDKLAVAGRVYVAVRIHTLALYVLGLAATAFAVAGYLALVSVISPALAAAAVGGGLVVLACVILYAVRSKPKTQDPTAAVDHDAAASQSNGSAMSLVEKTVREHPNHALLGAALLGGAMVVSPKTRRFVLTAATLISAKKRIAD